MILSKVYKDAEHKLERNEITLGEFERLVDIEVIESKHGEWIEMYRNGFGNMICMCSKCNFHATKSNFCPNCGADMIYRYEEAEHL